VHDNDLNRSHRVAGQLTLKRMYTHVNVHPPHRVQICGMMTIAVVSFGLLAVAAVDPSPCERYDPTTGSGTCHRVEIDIRSVICGNVFEKELCKAEALVTEPDGSKQVFYFKVNSILSSNIFVVFVGLPKTKLIVDHRHSTTSEL
jgi:hypothetical protein